MFGEGYVMCLGAAARGGEAERAPMTLADPTERKDSPGILLASSWVCISVHLDGAEPFQDLMAGHFA